jgi:hypothetical protein
MLFKLKSSGLPFKELGSSPAKQAKLPTEDSDATSVTKPNTPKVTGGQSSEISDQQYAEDFVKGAAVGGGMGLSQKRGKLAKDTIKKKGKMYSSITKKLKPAKKETDAERNKRLASNYETPAGAR